MNTYQPSQEWNDLRWGTVMPVTVMISSKIAELRARGSCSVTVTDPARLEEKVPEPENLTAYVKSLLAQTITDLIGERSAEVTDIAQLTTITTQIVQAFQANLETKFNPIGLKIKNVTIEAIESL